MEHITNKKIKITLPDIVGKQYDVVIGKSLNEQLVDFLKVQTGVSNIVIITDEYVEKLYGKKLLHNLRNSTLSPISLPVRQAGYLLSFPDGEQYKTQETVTKLQNQMFALACGRDTLIIALGGGVVGDIAGFVASTYMRGIPYIQMPTTLLAMVDSSVGGKTGIDNEFGKNLVGAFWQPLAVLADVDFLHTLPEEHIVSGLVEAIKMFLTHDKTSFQYVHDNYEDIINFNLTKLQNIIIRAVEIKSGVVMHDEKESNERRVLNFGHTIGHTIEKLSNYKILHGHAVGLGILVEAKIAELAGKLSKEDYLAVEGLVCKMVDKKEISKFEKDLIIAETKLDKKVQDGKTKYVLLESIGRVYQDQNQFAHNVDDNIVLQALDFFRH